MGSSIPSLLGGPAELSAGVLTAHTAPGIRALCVSTLGVAQVGSLAHQRLVDPAVMPATTSGGAHDRKFTAIPRKKALAAIAPTD